VDAPLLGNGDLLVALGGSPAKLQFHISKNDLWVMRTNDGSHPCPLARVDLEMPALPGASYRVEQDLLRAVTSGRFEKDGSALLIETGVAATENLLWATLSAEGATFRGKAGLFLPGQRTAVPAGKLSGGKGRLQLGREQHGGGRW
jgi:alpha-L-fucosidase 2